MKIARLSTAEEMRIVALLAQGQTYPMIKAHIQDKFGRTLSLNTINRVKKRNADSLKLITETVLAQEQANSAGILKKSRRLISGRLSKMEEDLQKARTLDEEYLAGKLTAKEWMVEKSNLNIPNLNELNAVSKEAFSQSRIESGLNPDGNEPSADPRKKLEEITQLLNEGDEIILERVVFGAKSHEIAKATIAGSGPAK